MTSGQKAGAGLGVTALAILTLVLSSQSLPFFQWLFSEAWKVVRLPLFMPTAIAVVVGAVASAWLPSFLPAQWPAARTTRITRLLASSIAFSIVVSRYPNAIGVQYGLFAASGAYVMWTMASGIYYRWRPDAQPESLKGGD